MTSPHLRNDRVGVIVENRTVLLRFVSPVASDFDVVSGFFSRGLGIVLSISPPPLLYLDLRVSVAWSGGGVLIVGGGGR